MKDIKRYDIELEEDPDNGHSMFQEEVVCNDGEWVKYSDHKAVVETLKTKLLNAHDTGFNTGYSQAEKDMQNKIEECGWEESNRGFVTACTIKQLTIEELREQFEIKFSKSDLERDKVYSDEYLKECIQDLWTGCLMCARANNIIKE